MNLMNLVFSTWGLPHFHYKTEITRVQNQARNKFKDTRSLTGDVGEDEKLV